LDELLKYFQVLVSLVATLSIYFIFAGIGGTLHVVVEALDVLRANEPLSSYLLFALFAWRFKVVSVVVNFGL